jgi:hypothetical protein
MPSMMLKPGTLLVVISALACGRSASGQDPRTPATVTECDAAIAAVDRLVSNPHKPSAVEQQQLWTATRCDARGGVALARLVPLARTSHDVPGLQNAEAIATNFSDSTVARAMLQLASDAGATAESRIFAFRVLMGLHAPTTWFDQPSSYSATGTACRTRTIAAPPPLPGAPLPDDFAQRAGTVAKSVANGTAAQNVRAAATCAYRHFGAFANLDVDATKISLSYVCGNDFRVRNDNAVTAPLTYRVAGTADEGDVNAPANGALVFRTDSIGTVNLFLALPNIPPGPQPIRSASNGGTACGS